MSRKKLLRVRRRVEVCSQGVTKSTALWAVLVAVLACACGESQGEGIQEPGPDPVTRVTVSAPTTRIRVGETVQLTATARGADGKVLEGREFAWSSGIGTVASVSPSGLVTGRVKGGSEIRATAEGVTGTLVIWVDVASRPDELTWPR